MILKLKRTPGLYLCRIHGVWENHDRNAAGRVRWDGRFADIDDDIEAATAFDLRDFRQLGEEAFRRMESEALAERVRVVARGHRW